MVQTRLVTIQLHSEMENTIDSWLEDVLDEGWSIASVHTTGVGAPSITRNGPFGFSAAHTWVVVVLKNQDSSTGPSSDGMNEDEARAVLGIGPDATREEIIQAHRRLMQRLHPDRGGSDYLAAKLNAAKDLLLNA